MFIFSYDACVDRVESNIYSAVDLAIEIWKMEEDVKLLGKDWMFNKMMALAHLCFDPYEALLLAKLIVEEQRIDKGNSVGKRGKYASRFHPRYIASRDNNDDKLVETMKNEIGSRPLTVGEISANWTPEFVETLEVRYRLEGGKEPLRKMVQHLFVQPVAKNSRTDAFIQPNVIPLVDSALTSLGSSNKCYVLLRNYGEDLEMAEKHFQSIETIVEFVELINEKETQVQMIERVLERVTDKTSVYVVHCHLNTLLATKDRILGYNSDSPSLFGTKCRLDREREIMLSLLLASWSKYNGLTQSDTALMDPWLNVLNELQLKELTSAKFTQI